MGKLEYTFAWRKTLSLPATPTAFPGPRNKVWFCAICTQRTNKNCMKFVKCSLLAALRCIYRIYSISAGKL